MKNPQPIYVIYSPPATGFPYLSVILFPDGTAMARQFDTAEQAAEYNREMAEHSSGRGVKH